MRPYVQRFFVVGLAGLLAGAAPSGAANTTSPALAPGHAAGLSLQHRLSATPRQSRARPDRCNRVGQFSFVGGSGGSAPNVAGGQSSGVLSGANNYACGDLSGVAVGSGNEVDGTNSFIGAGYKNTIAASAQGNFSFIGAGRNNTLTTKDAAIVSGLGNSMSGFGGFIGAGNTNSVTNQLGFIGAGQRNQVTGLQGAVAGGTSNLATGGNGFVGAGAGNVAGGGNAVVGGGLGNTASADGAAVVNGISNTASGVDSAIVGGSFNTASGSAAIVAGGYENRAKGVGSFAAGRGAQALHDGTFVWSDSNATPVVKSSGAKQFVARAAGGVTFYSSTNLSTGVTLAAGSGSWSSVSDRAVKIAIEPVDDAAILAKVASLPVSEWSYIAQGTGVRHVGPMAQDFRVAFGVGEDGLHIATVDESGVALAAIKGLDARTARENASLRARLAKDDAEIAALRAGLYRLASDVAALHRR